MARLKYENCTDVELQLFFDRRTASIPADQNPARTLRPRVQAVRGNCEVSKASQKAHQRRALIAALKQLDRDAEFPFLDLLNEIRVYWYELYLRHDHRRPRGKAKPGPRARTGVAKLRPVQRQQQTDRPHRDYPPLLRVCLQMHDEASDVLHKNETIPMALFFERQQGMGGTKPLTTAVMQVGRFRVCVGATGDLEDVVRQDACDPAMALYGFRSARKIKVDIHLQDRWSWIRNPDSAEVLPWCSWKVVGDFFRALESTCFELKSVDMAIKAMTQVTAENRQAASETTRNAARSSFFESVNHQDMWLACQLDRLSR